MEVKLKQVLFLNLCFRIFLLLCVLKENNVAVERPNESNSLVHKLKPISKRVVLVFVNGLGADFLNANSTPFLQEKITSQGSLGVALVSKMQTNYVGMKTVLTGRPSPNIPWSWINTRKESILDNLDCKCGMGNLPEDLPLKCRESDDNLILNFNKIISKESNKSCLLVVSSELDPITLTEYPERLKKIDKDIKFFSLLIDSYYNDSGTTYIVTSARGTPVGDSLTMDVPVIAWGSAISHMEELDTLKQTDIAAMLCVLLGVRFPAGLIGVVPMNLMNLAENYSFKITSYTINHYENVLGAVGLSKFLVHSSKLARNQLTSRLNRILENVKKANFGRSLINSTFVVVLLSLWGFVLTAGAFSGSLSLGLSLKQLFLLLLILSVTLYILSNREFTVTAALLLYWICQNGRIICTEYKGHFWLLFGFVISVFVGLIIGRFLRNEFALLFMFTIVVIWPILNGSFKRLNRFVLISRLLSGFSIGVLQFNRVFGEEVEMLVIACISFIFVFNFYLLFSIFKRSIDIQVKIISVMIFLTVFQIFLLHRHERFSRDEFSIFLLVFSLLSAYEVFGTVLERLMKIYLSFLIPVLLISMKDEGIFYFAMVFHTFTWIFIEYHCDKSSGLQYKPGVFSIEPKNNIKSHQFQRKDMRVVIFYLIYSYTAFFAMGHRPELISYDLYVLPAFVYKYPKLMSYFLGIFKFFLPFFMTTTSFVVFCGVREKSAASMMMISAWMADVISCCFIFFSQFVSRALPIVFRINYSDFIILQCATICALLSYFIGEHLLFSPKRFLRCVFRETTRQEKVTS